MKVNDLPRRGADPATNAEEITANDGTTLDETRAIYVGTSGDVKVDTADGDTVTFKNVVGGSILPIAVTKVYSTGTTASDFVGMR